MRSLIERLRGNLSMSMFARRADLYQEMDEQRQAAADGIGRLLLRIEELGEMGNICVGRDLGRRCSYCACDGRNLAPTLPLPLHGEDER